MWPRFPSSILAGMFDKARSAIRATYIAGGKVAPAAGLAGKKAIDAPPDRLGAGLRQFCEFRPHEMSGQPSFEPSASGAILLKLLPPFLRDRLCEFYAEFAKRLAKRRIRANLQLIEQLQA